MGRCAAKSFCLDLTSWSLYSWAHNCGYLHKTSTSLVLSTFHRDPERSSKHPSPFWDYWELAELAIVGGGGHFFSGVALRSCLCSSELSLILLLLLLFLLNWQSIKLPIFTPRLVQLWPPQRGFFVKWMTGKAEIGNSELVKMQRINVLCHILSYQGSGSILKREKKDRKSQRLGRTGVKWYTHESWTNLTSDQACQKASIGEELMSPHL